MKKALVLAFIVFFIGPVFLATFARAEQVWINDILANPSRYWNRTVTLVGQAMEVTANPQGTTRGFFRLLDDSGPNPITVKSKELPPIGKTYAVTGVVVQDPANASVPLLNEIKRTAPGMASNTLYILIGAGVVFLFLLIIFIVLLTKPKKSAGPATIRPGPQDTVRPAFRPEAPPAGADMGKTTKIPSAPPSPAYAAPAPDKTQVFMSLGADLIVEKGPDKGKEFPLHKQVMTIGRPGTRKNDVEVTDDTVSKDQASVYYDNTRKLFSIANESATNPTKVNGQLISGPTLLENDALIEMGRTVFRFKKA